jgi:hypothetical protein
LFTSCVYNSLSRTCAAAHAAFWKHKTESWRRNGHVQSNWPLLLIERCYVIFNIRVADSARIHVGSQCRKPESSSTRCRTCLTAIPADDGHFGDVCRHQLSGDCAVVMPHLERIRVELAFAEEAGFCALKRRHTRFSHTHNSLRCNTFVPPFEGRGAPRSRRQPSTVDGRRLSTDQSRNRLASGCCRKIG